MNTTISILYIEDDDAQRNNFESLLSAKGYSVASASSGELGLKFFREQEFDVVICDLNLPKMNGLDVLKQIKKLNEDIPVIILTGHGSVSLAVDAMKEGAYHFNLKPLEINDLEITIRQGIEKYRLQQQLKSSEQAVQSLEARVKARTDSLRQINKKLTSKAKDLENATYELARANIDMLAIQEQLEQKNNENEKFLQQLSQGRRQLQAILDSSESVILMIDSSSNIVATNKQVVNYFGLKISDIQNKPFADFTAKIRNFFDDSSALDTIVNKLQSDIVRENETKTLYENICKLTHPTERFVTISSGPVTDEDGTFLGKVWIFNDITKMKLAEETLRRSHEELEKRVVERTKAEKKTATRLRYEEGLAACSQSLLKYENMRRALIQAIESLREAANAGRVYIYENIQHPSDGISMKKIVETCAEGIETEVDNPKLKHIPYRDGFQRWEKLLAAGKKITGKVNTFPTGERTLLQSKQVLSILILPITIDKQWYGFIGFDNVENEQEWSTEDIRLLNTASEMIGFYISRKRASEALKISEARFRSLVENAHDIIYSMKPDGRFSYLSPQFKQLTGFDENDFIGKSLESLIFQNDYQAIKAKWDESTATAQTQAEFEYRIVHKDSNIRWFTAHSTNIVDDDGNVIEIIGIAHDVTELKKVLKNLEQTNSDLRQAQAQLVQTEKMASLGLLVAGIAHEINTPAGALNSMHNTLIRAFEKVKQELTETCPDLFETNTRLVKTFDVIENANAVIKSGTERVTNIVRRLRSFARLDEAKLKEVDIHEGLEDTLALVYHEIKHNIRIEKDFAQLPRITCYPSYVNQVFLNIIINAVQSIKEKGTISVTTTEKNNYIYIKISDTGSGIPRENLQRIFDPGFTTKGVRIGTGLGLSICYQIMKDHFGEIDVHSEVGTGTTFTLKLPKNLQQLIQSNENNSS